MMLDLNQDHKEFGYEKIEDLQKCKLFDEELYPQKIMDISEILKKENQSLDAYYEKYKLDTDGHYIYKQIEEHYPNEVKILQFLSLSPYGMSTCDYSRLFRFLNIYDTDDSDLIEEKSEQFLETLMKSQLSEDHQIVYQTEWQEYLLSEIDVDDSMKKYINLSELSGSQGKEL